MRGKTDISSDRIMPLVAELLRPLTKVRGKLSSKEIEASVVCFLILHGYASGRTREQFLTDLKEQLADNWDNLVADFDRVNRGGP